MRGIDFTGCDLTSAIFANCDLQDATFENTILEMADLRTSFHYSIDPTINKVKKAHFSLNSVAGLLHTFNVIIDHTL